MSDRMESDLPMPISSARTPPPVSEGKNGKLAFVITWQKLQEYLAEVIRTNSSSHISYAYHV